MFTLYSTCTYRYELLCRLGEGRTSVSDPEIDSYVYFDFEIATTLATWPTESSEASTRTETISNPDSSSIGTITISNEEYEEPYVYSAKIPISMPLENIVLELIILFHLFQQIRRPLNCSQCNFFTCRKRKSLK